MYEVRPEKVHHCYYNENGLCDISVNWQSRRVHWNAYM